MRFYLFFRVALVLAAVFCLSIPSSAEAGRRRRCNSCSCPSVSASSAPSQYAPGVQEIGAVEPSQFRCANGRCVLVKPASKATAPAAAKPAAPVKSTQAKEVKPKVITASNDSLRALGERIREQFENLTCYVASLNPPRSEKPDFLPDTPQLAGVQLSDTPDLE